MYLHPLTPYICPHFCYHLTGTFVSSGRGREKNRLTRFQAYFEAWSYAKSHVPTTPPESLTETQRALEKFIDNWTCEEFVGFVDDCRDVVDGLEIEKDGEMASRCEQVGSPFTYLSPWTLLSSVFSPSLPPCLPPCLPTYPFPLSRDSPSCVPVVIMPAAANLASWSSYRPLPIDVGCTDC